MDAMPKSAILMFLSASSSKFSGFKSRWLLSNVSFNAFSSEEEGRTVPYQVAVAIVNAAHELREEDERLGELEPPFLDQIIK